MHGACNTMHISESTLEIDVTYSGTFVATMFGQIHYLHIIPTLKKGTTDFSNQLSFSLVHMF